MILPITAASQGCRPTNLCHPKRPHVTPSAVEGRAADILGWPGHSGVLKKSLFESLRASPRFVDERGNLMSTSRTTN